MWRSSTPRRLRRRATTTFVSLLALSVLALPGLRAGSQISARTSEPEWFPVHRDANGAAAIIGCTYQSKGGQYGFDCAGHHPYWAIDVISSAGTAVYAAGAGWALDVTDQSGFGGYGQAVLVDHGSYGATLYAHLSRVLVPAEGAWVDPTTALDAVDVTDGCRDGLAEWLVSQTAHARGEHGERAPGHVGPIGAAPHGGQRDLVVAVTRLESPGVDRPGRAEGVAP